MGKSSKAPAVDYDAAARAQGQENRETAEFNAGANRVNQYGPDMSTEWTLKPGADPKNPKPGDYIQTVKYSDSRQKLEDQNNAINSYLMSLGSKQLESVGNMMGTKFDTSSLPGYYTSAGQVPMTDKGAGELQPYTNKTGGMQGMQKPMLAPGQGGGMGPGGGQPDDGGALFNALMGLKNPASGNQKPFPDSMGGAAQGGGGGMGQAISGLSSQPMPLGGNMQAAQGASMGKGQSAPQLDPAQMQAAMQQQMAAAAQAAPAQRQ